MLAGQMGTGKTAVELDWPPSTDNSVMIRHAPSRTLPADRVTFSRMLLRSGSCFP